MTTDVSSSEQSGAPEDQARQPQAGQQQSKQYTLSIDTGGTFTDGFVTDGEHSAQVKVDTTPHDLTVGFQACVEAAARAVGEDVATFLSSLTTLHFSSTIATNTIVERRGARVGLVVTAGAEESLYAAGDDGRALLDFLDPSLVRGVPEEVDDRGQVVTEPDAAALDAAVRELLERGVRLLVVSFANAHLNPANELRARAIIDRSYPHHYLGAIPLMIASRISLAPTDFGRTAVAVVNAYLHPPLVRTLYRAEDQVRDRGAKHPVLIVNTDGSSSRVAKTRAIDTYNSGPSAGVLGAGYVAEALHARHVCTFDVGGTTTDVAYLAHGAVPRDAHTDVGNLSIPHPSVSLWSFGLGGGSIIRVDESTGDLVVGPQSAGSSPGPACFGLGGTSLTPTDVWLLLGYLEPSEFLGGRRQLDRSRAEAVVSELAAQLGVSPNEAALRAKAAIRDTLAREMRSSAAGHDELMSSPAAERWLFSYGGGGGLLAVEAAEALDIPRVVVFPHSSVFSAFGGGLLPIAHSYEAVVPIGSDGAAVSSTIARLADNARRDLRAEGIHDISQVEAPVTIGDDRRVTTLQRLLDDEAATWASGDVDAPLRIHLDVSVSRDVRLDMHAEHPVAQGRHRTIRTEQGSLDVPIVGGLGQPNAEPVAGPAFLEAPDTTIFVPAGWGVEFTAEGYGVLINEETDSR